MSAPLPFLPLGLLPETCCFLVPHVSSTCPLQQSDSCPLRSHSSLWGSFRKHAVLSSAYFLHLLRFHSSLWGSFRKHAVLSSAYFLHLLRSHSSLWGSFRKHAVLSFSCFTSRMYLYVPGTSLSGARAARRRTGNIPQSYRPHTIS